jgi:hypothetical protein
MVDGDGMVDGHVDRQHRVEQRRITAGFRQRRAHGGDIDQGRDAGGVVHQHTAGDELDLGVARAACQPIEDGPLGRLAL